MASNIAVKLTAEFTDLQTKFAIARAESSALTSELNKLARQGVLTGTSDQMRPALQAIAASASGAQAKTAALRQELAKFGTDGGHGGISTATREFRALFDELSSGRTRQTPGTLAIIATRVLGLSGSSIAALAGVSLLTAGLGYLTVEGIKAANALADIKIGADFAGNVDLTKSEIDSLIGKLEEMPGISKDAATKIVSGFAEMHDAGAPLIQALALAVSDYATATHTEAEKAAENLKKAFENPLESGKKFLAMLPGVTQAEFNTADAAERAGNAHQMAAVMLEALLNALKQFEPQIQAHNGNIFASITNYAAWIGLMEGGEGPMEAQSDLISDQAKRWKQLGDAISHAANVQKTKKDKPTDIIQRGLKAGDDLDPTSKSIETTKEKIGEVRDALASAKAIGDSISISRLNTELAEGEKRLAELEQREKRPATTAAEKARQTADAVAQIQQQAQQAHIASEQRTNDFLLSMGEKSLDQWKAQADKLENDRYSAEVAFYNRKAKLDANNKKAEAEDQAHLTALKQENTDALLAIDQQYRDKQRQQDQTSLQDFVQAEKEKLAAGLDAIQRNLDAHRISAQDAHDQEVQLTRTVEAEVLKRKDAEIAGLTEGSEAYKQAIKERQALEIGFTKNVRTADDNLAKSQNAQWRQVSGSIRSSFNSALDGMLFRGQSLRQGMLQIGEGIVEAFLHAGEQIVEDWIENALISEMTSGTSAQAQIMTNAAVAGSAAIASTAAIPVIGPEMAAAAGAVAFNEAIAYSGLVGLAVGTSNVPRDMPAMIHQGEMVVPKFESNIFRELMAKVKVMTGGATGGFGAGGAVASTDTGDTHVHLHIHAVDTQSGADFVKKNMRNIADGLAAHLSVNGGTRSTFAKVFS